MDDSGAARSSIGAGRRFAYHHPLSLARSSIGVGMIRFRCGLCGGNIEAADQSAGGVARCPDCLHEVAVPVVSTLGTADSASPPPVQYSPPAQQYQPRYQPPGGQAQPAPSAVAALVVGIISLFLIPVPVVGLLASVIAISLGRSAKRAIAQEPGRYSGEGMAMAGYALGVIGVLGNMACLRAMRGCR